MHNLLKGAWETKISNREKRQQRKKEKGSNDESGSPGGGHQIEQPVVTAPVNTKKNKGKRFEDSALIIVTWLQQWITFYPNKYICA